MRITEKQLRRIIREELERAHAYLMEAELDEVMPAGKKPPVNAKGRASDAEQLAAALEQIQTYIQDKWAPAAKRLATRTGDKNILAYAEKLSAALQQAPVIRQAM